jgi:ElaB/YqjD/DUF883 family membrane-anchored ribosome-binding protein
MIAKVLMSPALEPLRNEIRDRATEALHSARDKMMGPTVDALRQTRDSVMERASQVERYANDQCERVARQVAANPFTALAIAFAAGWFASSIFGRARAEY